MKILISNKSRLPEAAARFIKKAGRNRIFAFYGEMGAGKTTIIRHICKALGSIDIATSPTFTIVNEYKVPGGGSMYHIDLYRIKKLSEIFDFGIEEYLSGGSYCFIEWPEIAEDILPADTVKVRLTVGKNERRIMEIV
jgi:tRNA threonylcarbamoyladenosine biosynthesis protein TsaE